MSEVNSKARCGHCGRHLSASHSGLCPRCGREGKTIDVGIAEEMNIASAISWEQSREYIRHNPWLNTLLWVATVGSPFAGFAVGEVPGAIIGLVVSVAVQLLGPRAVMKVREITKGGGQ